MFSQLYTENEKFLWLSHHQISVLAHNHLQSHFLEYVLGVALYNYEHGYL
jgi:hypothetical protein